jgi:anaerobic magnesium-protoporphyrin IX monomethyl ester cyclase
MKILFLFYEIPSAPPSYPLGPGLLSALLKNEGHIVQGMHIHEELTEEALSRIARQAIGFGPDLLAYSFSSPSFPYIGAIAKKLRAALSVPSVCGGAHATLYPEETLASGLFDYVAVGEGEVSMVEFVGALASGQDPAYVAGIWSMQNGVPVRNRLNPLVQDLDALENIDYELFGEEFLHKLTKDGWLRSISSRGCPYSCSYCHTPLFRERYALHIGVPKSRIGYLRMRSVDSMIEEINMLVGKYGVTVINFMDDLFCMQKSRTVQFCEAFETRVPGHVGYSIQTHLLHMDEEIAEKLKKSRCLRVVVGLESGSNRILALLKRKGSVALSRDKLELLVRTRYHLGTWTLNMLGIPTETLDEMLQTLAVSAQVLADRIKANIFAPYPGSAIYEFCEQNDLFIGDASVGFKDRWVTKLKFPAAEYAFLEKFYDIGHWYMNMLAPLDVEQEFHALRREAEQVAPGDWPSVRDDFLKHDAVICDKLARLDKPHYRFVLQGKVTAGTIGLYSCPEI